MDKDDIQKRILEDEDYIKCPKFSNSLSKFISKNPEGAEDASIARFLMMSEEQVDKIYQEAVAIIKDQMVDSDNES